MFDIDTLDIDIEDEVTAYYERLDQRLERGATTKQVDAAEVAEFARLLAQAAARWHWIAENPGFFHSVSDSYDYTDLDDLVAQLSDDDLEAIVVKFSFLKGEVATLWELFRRALAIWQACFGDQLPFEQVKDNVSLLIDTRAAKEYRHEDIEAALRRQRPN